MSGSRVVPVKVRWTAEFEGSSGLADPTTVTFYVRDPDAVVTSYVYGVDGEVTRVSQGKYRLTLTLVDPGQYGVRARAQGNVEANVEAWLTVEAPAIAP